MTSRRTTASSSVVRMATPTPDCRYIQSTPPDSNRLFSDMYRSRSCPLESQVPTGLRNQDRHEAGTHFTDPDTFPLLCPLSETFNTTDFSFSHHFKTRHNSNPNQKRFLFLCRPHGRSPELAHQPVGIVVCIRLDPWLPQSCEEFPCLEGIVYST